VRTTLQLAYHGCKNLTHTRKTRHVKPVFFKPFLGVKMTS